MSAAGHGGLLPRALTTNTRPFARVPLLTGYPSERTRVGSKARFIVRNFSDNFLLTQKSTGLAPDCLTTNPQ